jgi:hypothetical protein
VVLRTGTTSPFLWDYRKPTHNVTLRDQSVSAVREIVFNLRMDRNTSLRYVLWGATLKLLMLMHPADVVITVFERLKL